MTCPEYPKTDTLYTRGDDHVITNVIRRPEFLVPAKWLVTEKIDGTNIRISLEFQECSDCNNEDCESVFHEDPHPGGDWVMVIRGRTSKAQIPTMLFEHLQKTFTAEAMKALWLDDKQYGITLYGEGYGGGINKGGGQYTAKTKGGAASFRLFDVFIGETWLDRENVEDIATKLGIETVPLLGTNWNINDMVEMVREGFYSIVADEEGAEDHFAEGIMAFTNPPLFNSRGKRLMFKLKTKDFKGVPSYTRTDAPTSVTLTEGS